MAASTSAIDNVEHIYQTTSAAGRYSLRVSHAAGSAIEEYVLAWSVVPADGLDYGGDANLDGVVDVGDLGLLGGSYGPGDRTG